MWRHHPLFWIALFVVAILIETSLLSGLFPAGYAPNVMLCVTVALSLDETPRRGAAVGVIGGLLQDVAAGRLIGLNAFTLGLVGWGVAWARRSVNPDAVFVPGLMAGLAQLFLTPLQWMMLRMVGLNFGWRPFTHPLPAWILFAMLCTPAILGLIGPKPAER